METNSSFEKFCGGAIWDRELTWDTNDPDFTPCFHKTVLSWVPCFLLLLLSPYEVYRCLNSIHRKVPFNAFNGLKIALTLICVATSISLLAFAIDEDSGENSTIHTVDFVTPSIFLVTFTLSLLLLLLSLRYGVQSSPPQFFFYLLLAVCGGPIVRTLARNQDEAAGNADQMARLLTVFCVQYACGLALFILNCWSDATPLVQDERIVKLHNPCPQMTASTFSRLTYSWTDRLLWTGVRRPLEYKDLWDIDPNLTSRGILPDFDSHYENSVKSAESQKKPHSVYPALVFTFGPMFLVGSVLRLVYDIMAMVSPQIMKQMVEWVALYAYAAESGEEEDYNQWKGYFYAALLLVVTSFQTILLSQYFDRMFIVGMNLRTALISIIYRKALKMSGAARRVSTVGEIVNLMSVDVQRFMDILPYINMLWSAPLQMGLCCYFMYVELQEAMFAGLAILILAIPLNVVVAALTRRLQLEQMKNKDQRIKLMNEILGGVKVLKLYGWEKSFIGQILEIRDKEIVVLKKTAWLGAMVNFVWVSVPFLVALASFAVYIFMDEDGDGVNNLLTAEKAFVTMSYLNIMRISLTFLPFVIIGLVQVIVSLDRINKYLNNEELSDKAVDHDRREADPIIIENASLRWGQKEPTCLANIDIRVKKGSLTAVVGAVGAGKSSLISAMLGEMEKDRGRINVTGSVAYVPQQAWMQNATLKNNILFGKPDINSKYENVIDACALRSDLAILPGGDQTEIGEKGINLSGGQKQRVSLARACYSEADLFLLDDPLSAVDSHVGKHIFEKVISHNGLLEGKTRVLVTHGITYLPKTDHIIVLKDGKISEQGSYKELLDKKGDFAEFLLEYMTEVGDENEEELEEIKKELEQTIGKEELARQTSIRPRTHSTSTNGSESSQKNESILSDRRKSLLEEEAEVAGVATSEKKAPVTNEGGATLIEKEVAETGSVKVDVYFYYLRNVGTMGVILGLFMQAFYAGSSLMTNYWLTWWTEERFGNATVPKNRDMYLGVYGAFGIVQAVSSMVLSIVLAVSTLTASKRMHKDMLEHVMRSPMSFFDTTPLGRIVNRFAKDVDVCDNTLPTNIRQWLATFANFLSTVILIITALPFFAAVILPLSVVYVIIQKIYVDTSRQLKRLESISRSPIYSHFGETITGASTIRAFGREQAFITESEQKVDYNQKSYYPSLYSNRWLAVRLETIGNLSTFAAAMFVVIDPLAVSPSEVGLVISYALNVTQVLTWLVRMTADVETNIVAVERTKEYSLDIKQEAEWELPEKKPTPEWPYTGTVSFENYGMRYREGLDLVVSGINANIKGGDKVGIVGRTGAGKSSLTVALFRLVEPAMGRIVIDGVDIASIGLHDLRKKLTIIPQDPVLFSGTLRVNLDPFNMHTDEEVWKALELAHLKHFASSLADGLEHEVSEGGDNISVGQRQLVCLARALLRKTKVLILDEATAAVDLETDDLIQATIRKEFDGCTVLTIAHRLNTIMDYDQIMVLDKGKIVEFDPPQTLLANTETIFYGMAKDANLV